jgi:menaquinone-dependent protoporphyrinogen IX oxidase
MIPVLIAYSTTEGQAGKIAGCMAKALGEAGYRADVVDVDSPQASLVQPMYAMAILGGSVHAGHHADALARFVKSQDPWLR